MGAFLDKPKTDKITVSGEANGIRYGVSAMQGWRMEMEDAHVCKTNLAYDGCSFFGVFDGHAGPKVSQYCSENLWDCIRQKIEAKKGPARDQEPTLENITVGFRDGFLYIDEKLKERPPWSNGEDRGGTTAITVMITPKHIILGNCGDSRGLVVRSNKLEIATTDHKPYNQSERSRIEKAGGTVMMQRVNGSLAVSRALGDFDYKRSNDLPAIEQLVSPEPEVTVVDREPEKDQFLLLACDGIYDVMSNEQVIEFVLHHLKLTDDLSKICSALIDTCLNKNSRDNMSVVLVTFPSAPKVSEKAIEEEMKLQAEAMEEIKKKLEQYAEGAVDQLDLEENTVLQNLSVDLPERYDVMGKKQRIVELLKPLKIEKFGNIDDNDFSGAHDPSNAPDEFAFTYGDNKFIVTPEIDMVPSTTSDDKQSTIPSDQTSSPLRSSGDSKNEQKSSKKTKT